jgi:hypothetical protein
MVGSLFQLANLGLSSRPAQAESTGFSIPSGYLGFVVLGLIGIPVVLLVSSAIFGAPRNMKVPGLFLVCLGVLISATIVGFALVGSLLGFVFPK